MNYNLFKKIYLYVCLSFLILISPFLYLGVITFEIFFNVPFDVPFFPQMIIITYSVAIIMLASINWRVKNE